METAFQDNSEVQVQLHSEFTVQDLVQILKITRRTVFNYSKIICDCWHWEPEAIFKPVFGKYSQRALDEMKLLKEIGTEAYKQKVSSQEKPVEFIKTEVAIVPNTKNLTLYETKVLNQQQLADKETLSAIQKLQQLKQEIDTKTNRINLANNANREARLNRLKARAMRQALEDFQVMSEVYNSTIQQLEIEQLGE